MRNRLIIIKSISLLAGLVITGQLSAQKEAVIDTSEYLPLFYDGALEYNLIIAATKGYSSEVKRIINMGAEVDAKTSEGATPLIFAIINKKPETVDTLIAHGADVNIKTIDYQSPLLIAVKNGALEISESLIRYGAEIDFQDRYGATPLHYASIYGYFYLADLLIYYKADADKKSDDGTTPLMASIWAGHDDVADLLIQNGANMEARDEDGFTPLLIAAQNGDTLMLNLLKKKGVDLLETNKSGWNALALAIKSDQKDAAELLLRTGKGWTDQDKITVNPYYAAVKYRRKGMIDLLQKYNITPAYKPEFDQTVISLTGRFSLTDFFSGISIALKEPATNFGIFAGCDAKLWYTRVLKKAGEDLFIEYFDKSYALYAGISKEYQLTDNIFGSNISVSGYLSAAYTFGNKFRGSTASMESKLRIKPGADLRWSKNNFSFSIGAEYLRTEFYNNGPLWARAGFSYKFLSSNIRDKSKNIKWY